MKRTIQSSFAKNIPIGGLTISEVIQLLSDMLKIDGDMRIEKYEALSLYYPDRLETDLEYEIRLKKEEALRGKKLKRYEKLKTELDL